MAAQQDASVILLWHIHHSQGHPEGPPRDDLGNVEFDDDEDDLKIIGVFSSAASVDEAIAATRLLQGFRDEPECFLLDEYTLDNRNWQSGFVTIQGDE